MGSDVQFMIACSVICFAVAFAFLLRAAVSAHRGRRGE